MMKSKKSVVDSETTTHKNKGSNGTHTLFVCMCVTQMKYTFPIEFIKRTIKETLNLAILNRIRKFQDNKMYIFEIFMVKTKEEITKDRWTTKTYILKIIIPLKSTFRLNLSQMCF